MSNQMNGRDMEVTKQMKGDSGANPPNQQGDNKQVIPEEAAPQPAAGKITDWASI